MIRCEVCGKDFEKRNKRGRPPKVCYECKDKHENLVEENRKAKQESNKNLSAVPVLEPVVSVDIGDVVYILPSLLSDAVLKRQYAKQYKVLSINGSLVEVVRDIKSPYRNYPATVPIERLMQKTGTEYMEISRDDGIIEEQEGID